MMKTTPLLGLGLVLAMLLGTAAAQTPPSAKPSVTEHAQKDIARHRAMAKAHEDAARCLEAGEDEAKCQKALLAACRGLAIGKFCGMKHEH